MKVFTITYIDPYYGDEEIIGVANSEAARERIIQESIDASLGARQRKNFDCDEFELNVRK